MDLTADATAGAARLLVVRPDRDPVGAERAAATARIGDRLVSGRYQ